MVKIFLNYIFEFYNSINYGRQYLIIDDISLYEKRILLLNIHIISIS